ncbi:hypothetical protein CsSME_00049467 [Camellia sinensis var. sinensis]
MEGIAEEVDIEDSQGDLITDMIVIRAILLILTLVVKSVESSSNNSFTPSALSTPWYIDSAATNHITNDLA